MHFFHSSSLIEKKKMVAEGKPLGKEYVDADGVKYIPLTHIENHMNEGDQTRLLEYLDQEFLGAVPDALTKDADQIELEMKEKIDINFDSDDDDEMHELTEDQKAMIMNPREYQYELYQKALEDNVIVVLDTGAGKTLIAVMLLKQTSLIEREERLRRRNVSGRNQLYFFA